MPLGPIPPNGNADTAKWNSASFTDTPPASVARRIFSMSARSWLKGYSASGRSCALT